MLSHLHETLRPDREGRRWSINCIPLNVPLRLSLLQAGSQVVSFLAFSVLKLALACLNLLIPMIVLRSITELTCWCNSQLAMTELTIPLARVRFFQLLRHVKQF